MEYTGRNHQTIRVSILLAFLIFSTLGVKAQVDSLNVVFYGRTTGEKYRVYVQEKQILKFKTQGAFRYVFKVGSDKPWKDGAQIRVAIYRKGKFGLCYRGLRFNPGFSMLEYNAGKKFYIIDRDNRLKNKYAVLTYWLSGIPKIVD